jgi:hypothetical protein
MASQKPKFSREGYIEVLNHAISERFLFRTFNEKDEIVSDNKYCLMRHDIDTSLKCALEMAEIEYSKNIRATYFFMLRSPAYNLFSRYAYHVLHRIVGMGHEIALHFDAAHPTVEGRDLIHSVLEDVNTLSRLISSKVTTVSFHQPSKEILRGDLSIPGITNTYNKDQMSGWYYASDSNRIWKEHTALSVFSDNKYQKVQVLTHPIWWIYDDELIEDAWDKAIVDNFYIMQQQFLDTEGAYGPKRIFNLNR